MKLRHFNPLCFWLATILLMAAGVIVPGAASAHPGHGDERAQRLIMAFQPSSGTSSLGVREELPSTLLLLDASQPAHPATFVTQPDENRGYAGAACCGTGHGCCVAYLYGGENPPSPPTGNRLAIVLRDAPSGLGAAKLPEPPRPIR